MKEREKLKSRLGFILISAGCAIGIGNVWKFPYIAGKGGGGAFVLCYLIFLVILGLPVMTMEFAVGRASQKSPVKAYQALEKPGQKWHIHGYITVIGCYLLMMFYTTVSGWMLHYFYLTATGKFAGLDAESVEELLGDGPQTSMEGVDNINDALRLDFKSDRNVTVIYKGEEIGTFPWSVALGYCSIESENPSLTVMINDDGTLKVDYSDDDDYYTFHCVKSDSE